MAEFSASLDGQSNWIESYRSNGVIVRTTRQMSITLPNGMADAVRQRVESGDYASESEVVRDGLRSLFAKDEAVERWLREEVADAYDAMQADPQRGRSLEEVRARLRAAAGE
jgi:antitoxin ParD1/3/4